MLRSGMQESLPRRTLKGGLNGRTASPNHGRTSESPEILGQQVRATHGSLLSCPVPYVLFVTFHLILGMFLFLWHQTFTGADNQKNTI